MYWTNCSGLWVGESGLILGLVLQIYLPEAFLKSAKSGKSTLFLDYLGFDRDVNLPLMIFEAKRFSMEGRTTSVNWSS